MSNTAKRAVAAMACLLALGCSAPIAQKSNPNDYLDTIEAAGARAIEQSPVAAGPRVLITGARVMTAAGDVWPVGYVLFDHGRITHTGQGTPPPELTDGAHLVDAGGHVLTPGIIDSHSHIAVYRSPSAAAHRDGNEMVRPTTPGVWAEHASWPQAPGFETAMAGGITTLHILPGSGNLIGGRGVTLHNVPHRGARAMRFPGAPDTLKMACGENPKRYYGGKRQMAPMTRMGNLWGQRKAFGEAQAWLAKFDSPDLKTVERDLANETLAGVLLGRILPQVHCYRADDMLTFLQLADEFGFEIRSFHHAVEAYKIRDVLAKRKVSVSTWADWWGFKLEAYDGIPENAAMVSAAGGITIIHSDSATGIQRLNQEAAKAMHSGRHAGLKITENEALRWITFNPAWAIGIEKEVGTIEVGKRADLVVWDGSPFSVYSRPRWVFVDGQLRYDKGHKLPPWSDFQLGQEAAE